MIDACPGSARPKRTWILSANSLSKQQHWRQWKKKERKKCPRQQLGIPVTWSVLKVQRLPLYIHKNRWVIVKNSVNFDMLNAWKNHTTLQCLLNLFMKWSSGCLAKEIFKWYYIRSFFSGVNGHWPTSPVFGSSSVWHVLTPPHSLEINGLWKGSACLSSDLCFLQTSLFVERPTWSETFQCVKCGKALQHKDCFFLVWCLCMADTINVALWYQQTIHSRFMCTVMLFWMDYCNF